MIVCFISIQFFKGIESVFCYFNFLWNEHLQFWYKMIAIIVLLLIVILNLWWFIKLARYNSLQSVPGPKPLPFVGNALSLGRTPQEILKSLYTWSKDYGEIYKIFVATECKVVVSDPEILEKIVSSNVHITKSNTYGLLKDWLGDGLVVSNGEKWKRRRKLLTPCFHFTILEKFMANFAHVADELVANLQSEVGGKSFDILPFVNLSSVQLMCESSMGVKIDTQVKNNVEYVTVLREYLKMFLSRAFSAWQRFDVLFKFTPSYKSWLYFINILHEFAENIINKRRDETKSDEFRVDADEVGMKPRIALLDFLLKAERENLVNGIDIKDEINTFLFAGHDTTTAGLTYLLLMLSRHQDVQQKVFEEILDFFGDQAAGISLAKVQDMKYLDCVIRETMRLYPPIPAIERSLECELNIDGLQIPAKTTLTLLFYGMHHNEKYFPDPEKFDPSRFFPDNVSNRHKYCYLPFSAGPRNCIGQRFALLALKVFAIKLMLKYKVMPVENFEPDLGLAAILKSFNGIKVRLYNRVA